MTEAGTMSTPWRRQHSELLPLLTRWARHTYGGDWRVANLAAPEGTGMSSETVLFDLDGGDERIPCVARLAPQASFYPVFPRYDLDLQRQAMDLVRTYTTVPVPTVLHVENDPAWLETPFLVMRRIDGLVPADVPSYVFGGWLFDLGPAEQARLQRNAVAALAGIHSITAADHDLSAFARPDLGCSPLDRQLGYQRWYYDWARDGIRYPLIDRTLSTLR